MNKMARMQVRMPEDIHKWIVNRAKQADRSLNAEIVRILRELKEMESKAA